MTVTATSHKTALGGLAAAIWAFGAVSCGGPRAGSDADSPSPLAADTAQDWGLDWDRSAGPAADRAGRSAGSHRSTVWTIVLATFPAGGQPQVAAQNMVSQLATLAPQLTDVWVHNTDKGSMVVYGRYDGPQTKRAQADLELVKGITYRDSPMFGRAMLTRVSVGPDADRLNPMALVSVRTRYPNVDPLYTIEVAMWSDFGSGKLTLEQIHRSAEDYARQLRAKGFDAYFFHDDDSRISTVTVGLFNRTAIDHRSGLYSAEVDAVMRRFPAHLVNGEELLEPIDGHNPARGTRVQQPMLVNVPK